MSRKLESVGIEINEGRGIPISIQEAITPGKHSIGIIKQEGGRYHVVPSKTNHNLYSKTLESAINGLLSYFTLHEK